jgi:hypothetical protein
LQQMQEKGKVFGDLSDTQSTYDLNYSMDGSGQYQMWMADTSDVGKNAKNSMNGNFQPLNLGGNHFLEGNIHEPTDKWPAWAKQALDATAESQVGANPFANNPLESAEPQEDQGGPPSLNLAIGNELKGGSMSSSLGRTAFGEAYLAREERPLSAAAYEQDHGKERQAEEEKIRMRKAKLEQQKREEEEFRLQMQLEKERRK